MRVDSFEKRSVCLHGLAQRVTVFAQQMAVLAEVVHFRH